MAIYKLSEIKMIVIKEMKRKKERREKKDAELSHEKSIDG